MYVSILKLLLFFYRAKSVDAILFFDRDANDTSTIFYFDKKLPITLSFASNLAITIRIR